MVWVVGLVRLWWPGGGSPPEIRRIIKTIGDAVYLPGWRWSSRGGGGPRVPPPGFRPYPPPMLPGKPRRGRPVDGPITILPIWPSPGQPPLVVPEPILDPIIGKPGRGGRPIVVWPEPPRRGHQRPPRGRPEPPIRVPEPDPMPPGRVPGRGSGRIRII